MKQILTHLVLLAFACGVCLAAPRKPLQWNKLEGWELDGKEQPEDGDSFKVKPKEGRKHPFTLRLYGVDTPETSDRIPGLVEEQAKDFKVDPKKIPEMGKAAREFTRKFLLDGFTIEECGEEATNGRRYGILRNLKGERLDEALLKAGLARIDRSHRKNMAPYDNGKPLERKDEDKMRRNFANDLFPLESAAKREKKGFWGNKWRDLLQRPEPKNLK
jgi:endonuclease YncB( thermonuclease family)